MIVRSSQDLWTQATRLAPEGFGAIFDANGVSTLRPGFEQLARGGKLVVYGFAEMLPRGKDRPNLFGLAWNWLRVPRFSPLEMTSANRSLMGFNIIFLFDQLDRARQNLQIVNTRVRTGAAAGTEGRQAEVDLGRAEVVLILARRDVRQARLLLSEQLGVSLEEDVIFLSEFEIFEPDFDMDRLMRMAMDEHPSLQSFRAQESATRAAARQSAVSQYLPSLNFFAQMRGQAQEATNSAFVEQQLVGQALGAMNNCEFSNTLNNGLIGGLPGYSNQDCASLGLVSEEALTSALAANRAFPFNFTEMPMFVGVQISLPIFTGFSRERQVSQANNLAEDAQHSRRAEELRLRTMVTGAFDNLTSAYQVVAAEGRNRALSEEQLLLQRRRYTLGAADMLLLMDAQTTMTTADQAYLNAIYDFHYNLIALEAAVGQPLR